MLWKRLQCQEGAPEGQHWSPCQTVILLYGCVKNLTSVFVSFFFFLHYYYFWPGRRLLGKVLKYNPCTISKGWKLPQTLQCNIVMTFKSAEWFESSVGLCEILLSFLLLLYLPALVKVRTLRRLSKSTDGRPLRRVSFRTASVWCAFCCFANSVIVIQTGNVFWYVRRPLGPLSLWKKLS